MNRKTAVVLHGWPQPEGRRSIYREYFRQNGYRVVSPFLFDERVVFSLPSVQLRIHRLLAGDKPHVIVGISMGGLLAPIFLHEYPKAKGVFIASNARLAGRGSIFYKAVHAANNPVCLRLLGVFRYLPTPLLRKIYSHVNQFDGNTRNYQMYLNDMIQNIKYIRRISIRKQEEIIRFVCKADNTTLLRTIDNPCLVFSGLRDDLMPASSDVPLHKLLPYATFIRTGGGHYNVFTKENVDDLTKFLKIG